MLVQFKFVFVDADLFPAFADADEPLVGILLNEFDSRVSEIWLVQRSDVSGSRFPV